MPRRRAAKAKKTAGKAKTARRVRQQYGALPFRTTASGAFEVLLITSRDTGRWIIPKGWPMKRKSPRGTAKTEAFEEAGVRGEIEGQIGSFSYVKRMAFGKDRPCKVGLFLLRVTDELEIWPERDQRTRRWVSVEDGAGMIDEPDLHDLMLATPSFVAGLPRT